MKNKVIFLISKLSFTTFLFAVAIIMAIFSWHWQAEMEDLKKQFTEVRHEVSNLRLETAGVKTMLMTEITRAQYLPPFSHESNKDMAPKP